MGSQAASEDSRSGHSSSKERPWPKPGWDLYVFTGLGTVLWATCMTIDVYTVDESQIQVPKSVEVTYSFCAVAYACNFLLSALRGMCMGKQKRLIIVLAIYVSFLASCTYTLMWLGVASTRADMKSVLYIPGRWVLYCCTMPAIWWILAHISAYSTRRKLYVLWLNWVMLIAGGLATIPWISWGHKVYWMTLSCVPFPELCFHLWRMIADSIDSSPDIDAKMTPTVLKFIQTYGQFSYQFFPAIYFAAFDGCLPLHVSEPLWSICDWCLKMAMTSSLMEANFYTVAQHRDYTLRLIEQAQSFQTLKQLTLTMERKDRFLSAMSHEVRTPLNGIIGMSEAVMALSRNNLHESVVNTIEVIMLSSKRLLQLINDILDAAQIRQGFLVIRHEAVDVVSVINNVLELAAPLARPNVRLYKRVGALPTITADGMRLTQILFNLVSNACKFTLEGSIRVTAGMCPAKKQLFICVGDTGTGIPLSQVQTVFHAFEQGDMTSTRQHGGTGLGLHLVKELVHAHGGHITVQSKIGQGSMFTLWMPTTQTERGHTPALDGDQIIVALDEPTLSEPRVLPPTDLVEIPKTLPRMALSVASGSAPAPSLALTQSLPNCDPSTLAAAARDAGSALYKPASVFSRDTALVATGPLPSAALSTAHPGGGSASGKEPRGVASALAKSLSERAPGSPLQRSPKPPHATPHSSSSLSRGTSSSTSVLNGTGVPAGAGLPHSASAAADLGDASTLRALQVPSRPKSRPSDAAAGAAESAPSLRGQGPASGHRWAPRRSTRAHLESQIAEPGVNHHDLPMLPTPEDRDAPEEDGPPMRLFHSEVYGTHMILSVDDDPVNQMVVSNLLQPLGYELRQAMNGTEAMTLLSTSDTLPDVILLDCMMPGISGYDVCNSVRKLYGFSIPIIMVSANSSQKQVLVGLEQGATDYIKKPFHRDELNARIRTHIHTNQLLRQELEMRLPSALLHVPMLDSMQDAIAHGESAVTEALADTAVLHCIVRMALADAACARALAVMRHQLGLTCSRFGICPCFLSGSSLVCYPLPSKVPADRRQTHMIMFAAHASLLVHEVLSGMGLNAVPSLALAFGDIHAAALSHAPYPPRMVLTGMPVRLAASLAQRVPPGCIHIATHAAVSDAASPGFQHTVAREMHLGASVSVLKLAPVNPCELPDQALTTAPVDPKLLRYARRVLSCTIRAWLDLQSQDKSAGENEAAQLPDVWEQVTSLQNQITRLALCKTAPGSQVSLSASSNSAMSGFGLNRAHTPSTAETIRASLSNYETEFYAASRQSNVVGASALRSHSGRTPATASRPSNGSDHAALLSGSGLAHSRAVSRGGIESCDGRTRPSVGGNAAAPAAHGHRQASAADPEGPRRGTESASHSQSANAAMIDISALCASCGASEAASSLKSAGWTILDVASATEGQLKAFGINQLRTRVRMIVSARKAAGIR